MAGKRDTAWIWVQRGVKFPLDVVACRDEVIGFIKTRREGCLILVRPGYEDLTPLGEWHRPGLSQAVHTVKHMGTFQVEMRDGVKLATEVYLPGDLLPGTKVPTILIRTPYGRTKFAEPELRFVFRGYAVVAQDCRGRGDSEGEWLPFVHELADGSDTLDWIAAQPWSNGKVGMIGGSYGGFVQWAAAGSGNPSARDTDWVIRVTDVDDQGNSIRVSDGILRARYRHGFDCPKLLTPGQVEEYRLRLTRVGYVFKEGHRIRVQVTSGAQNLAFPNTNTGDDPAADAESVVANQTVLHEPDYPSHVELPLLS